MDNVEAVTLFVKDLDLAKRFYMSVFGVDPVYEDDVSWVISISGLLVNLLQTSEAHELVEPMKPGDNNSGPRVLLTCRVGDVDAVCKLLQEKGIGLLNGPIDRPWGRRTAAFADPEGHVWEVAQAIG